MYLKREAFKKTVLFNNSAYKTRYKKTATRGSRYDPLGGADCKDMTAV